MHWNLASALLLALVSCSPWVDVSSPYPVLEESLHGRAWSADYDGEFLGMGVIGSGREEIQFAADGTYLQLYFLTPEGDPQATTGTWELQERPAECWQVDLFGARDYGRGSGDESITKSLKVSLRVYNTGSKVFMTSANLDYPIGYRTVD